MSVLLLFVWITIVLGTLRVKNNGDIIDMAQVVQTLPYDNPDGGPWKQGWEITYDSNLWDKENLRVFVVPHSHNDPGWLMTFDEYYERRTRNILNSLTRAMYQDPNRHFIWAEISFFHLWWNEQSEQVKQQTKRLIKNGQLEFVTGGWVMNDEATPHYYAIINQLTEGHEWLRKELDYKPVSAWSIDPFGHSPTQAYLYSLIGFDGMLIQRIHYAIKKKLALEQNLEFLWRQTWDKTGTTDMFTHMMPFFSYDIPHTCGPTPAVCALFEFTKSSTAWGGTITPIDDGNIKQRSQQLLDEFRKKSVLYRTKNVLVPLGDDFYYQSADDCDKMFPNHEKVHTYLNSKEEDLHVEVHFSNLSSYFEAIWDRAEKNDIQFPVLTGDFFTYADKNDEYWSGYFTTRPFWKRLERDTESVLRTAEILYSIAKNSMSRADSVVSMWSEFQEMYKDIETSRRAIALFQHHDGTTGTAKDHVVLDYGNRLHHARWLMKDITIKLIKAILQKKRAFSPSYWKPDEEKKGFNELASPFISNIGDCKVVVIFNPLTVERNSIVSLRVTSANVKVVNAALDNIPCQVNPVFNTDGSIAKDRYTLYFMASVPAFGFSTFFVERADSPPGVPRITLYNDDKNFPGDFLGQSIQAGKSRDFIKISNGVIDLEIDPQLGTIQHFKNKQISHKLKEEYMAYRTAESGAYLFMANDQHAEPLPIQPNRVSTRVIVGSLVTEVSSVIAGSSVQAHTIRLYHESDDRSDAVEVINLVHVLDEGQEVVIRYSTDIENEGQFYTDLNGFYVQKRKYRDDRPIQHNFYPSTSFAFFQDSSIRLNVISRQALACGGIRDGSIEYMIDRRLGRDDNRGLGQGVRDNIPTEAHFFLRFEKAGVSRVSLESQLLGQYLNHPLQHVIVDHNRDHFLEYYHTSYSFLTRALPPDFHIVAMKPRNPAISQDIILQVTRWGVDESSPKILIDFSDAFACAKPTFWEEHTLTLLHFKQNWIGKLDKIPFEPFELRAFLVRFESTRCQPPEISQKNRPQNIQNTELMAVISELQKELRDAREQLQRSNPAPYYYMLIALMVVLFVLGFYERSQRRIAGIFFVIAITTTLPFFFLRSASQLEV